MSDTSWDRVRELCLLCAHARPDPAGLARLGRLVQAGIDWELLAAAAERQGIPTLVYHHLRGLGADHLAAPAAWARLEADYRAAALNAMRQRCAAGSLLDALQARGIPVIVLKGLVLSEVVYPDPALRPCCDIDLLVEGRNAVAAETVLREQGYEADEQARGREWYRPGVCHHLAPYLHPQRQVQVEVHWDLAPPRAGLAVDVAGLWARAQLVSVAGRRVGALSPEDTLLHLSLHAAAVHRLYSGLRHLVDVGEWIGYCGSRLDWDEALARAARWGADRHLSLVLRLAQDLLGAALPAAAWRGYQPGPADEAIAAIARERLLGRTPAGEAAAEADGLARLWCGGPPGGRLAAAWQGLFPPRERMARYHGLRSQSWRCYGHYALRPLRLLLRYGPLLAGAALGRPGGRAVMELRRQAVLLDDWLDGRQRDVGHV